MAFTGLGAGVLGDPYQITTWAQFQEISTNLAAHFKLMNDIDANTGFLTQNNLKFTGVFDGDNHRLINYGNSALAYYLFIPSGATIKKLKLISFNSTGFIFSSATTNADTRQICINTTFENISIVSDSKFAYDLTNCTVNNVYHLSKNLIEVAIPTYFYFVQTTNNVFTNCFFYFIKKYTGINSISFNNAQVGIINTYNSCTFIFNIDYRQPAGVASYGSINLFQKGSFNKCSISGDINVDGSLVTSSNGSDRVISLNFATFSTADFSMTDCHLDLDLVTTWGVNQAKLWSYLLGRSGGYTRVFTNGKLQGFTLVSTDTSTNTNVFAITGNPIPAITPIRPGVTVMSAAQSIVPANFTNFDFANVWEPSADGTPKLKNVAYEFANVFTDVLNAATTARNSSGVHNVSINLIQPLPAGSTVKCYVSNSPIGIEAPENLNVFAKVDDYNYISNTEAVEGLNHYLVVYENGAPRQELTGNFVHYFIDQKATSIINAIAPNYKVCNDANSIVEYIHGFLFHNGFIFGSARSTTNNGTMLNIIRLQANDYTQVLYKKIYRDKISHNFTLSTFDQIVYCSGFIWAQSVGVGGSFLVRINPSDLDYMVFNVPELASKFQPIGTDGTFLYYTGDTKIYKLDTLKLIGLFASYNYTNEPVNIPANTILGECLVIQLHPTVLCYSHSVAVDENYIYLAVTTSSLINGYDLALDLNICHLQKIDKNTMITAADVVIPRSTDDICQNDSFIFLAPELTTTVENVFGASWGLLAVRKSNLEIKYLKALHSDFNTENESDRQTFGVQYYGGKIIVQLTQSLKSVVISLNEIEQWGANFPVGGATENIYKFQINGVNVVNPANELEIDNDGSAHVTLWGTPSTVLKFSASEMGISPHNALSLRNNDTVALLEFLDTHFGCSIRCVQDAQGIADGTTGTVADIDGNIYDTVVINERRWMVQNLKTTKYLNGDPIPNITDPALWELDEPGGRCAYNNNIKTV